MKVEGRRISYMAEALGVKDRTLHLWFSDDLVKAEVARLLSRVEDVFVEARATAGLRALNELSAFSETPATRIQATATCRTCGYVGTTTAPHGTADPKCDGPWDVTEREYIGEGTKVDALNSIMDRVDQTTRLRDRVEAQKAAPEGDTTNYTAVFNQMDDDTLAGLVALWAKAQGADGHPPDHPALSQ